MVVDWSRKNTSSGPPMLDDESPLTVVPRSDWGAEPPKDEGTPLTHPVKFIGYSFTTEPYWTCITKEECIGMVKDLQKRDMEERGLSDIAYNFVIGDDGNVYEGRGWHKRPERYFSDPEKYDSVIDVCFVGMAQAKWIHWGSWVQLKRLGHLGIKNNYIVKEKKHWNLEPQDSEVDQDPVDLSQSDDDISINEVIPPESYAYKEGEEWSDGGGDVGFEDDEMQGVLSEKADGTIEVKQEKVPEKDDSIPVEEGDNVDKEDDWIPYVPPEYRGADHPRVYR